MDWIALYAYPSQLLKLQPGNAVVFVCPPVWRGRLSTVCGIWIRRNTDWASRFPSGTPWKQVFWTATHDDGLKVVRAPLSDHPEAELSTPRVVAPLIAASMPDQGMPKLDQVVSLWRNPSRG
jgi:hypothetical protein